MHRSSDDSLRRVIRVLREEAAALAGGEPELASWLTRIADHLIRAVG